MVIKERNKNEGEGKRRLGMRNKKKLAKDVLKKYIKEKCMVIKEKNKNGMEFCLK